MAKNGPEWADYSMRYNSGTYNNQYMVIDTKLFQKGLPLMVVGVFFEGRLYRAFFQQNCKNSSRKKLKRLKTRGRF